MRPRHPAFFLPLVALALAACDQLGIETPVQANARAEAEGKAVGGACRHAGRALEDCYLLNKRASKAAVYAGWRDMDAYMRENQIEVIEPSFENEKAPPKKGDPAATEMSPEAPAVDTGKPLGDTKKPGSDKPATDKPAEKSPAAKTAPAKHGALGSAKATTA